MIKVTISVPEDFDGDLTEVAAKKLRVKLKGGATILKKSLDARNKRDIRYVYTLAAETDFERTALKNGGSVFENEDCSLRALTKGASYKGARPIVVGAGPAGLFAALTLCQIGAPPIIIERGQRIEDRQKTVEIFNGTLALDPESNVLFGEGGAGAFSDGKLNTGVNGPFVRAVLSELADNGAPEEIVYINKPHVGTDRLMTTVRNIREKLKAAGAEFHFGTRVGELLTRGGRVTGVRTDKGDFFADRVYLAVGHSARDTFYMLNAKGVILSPKIFSSGVRIEHLQEEIDFAQYGRARKKLPPADYKAAVRLSGGATLYTFCMCPGGSVINASSEAGGVCVNGMSNYARDGRNANSALLINVTEKECGEGIFAGLEFQRALERRAYEVSGSYRPPAQTFGDFLCGRTGGFSSVTPGVATGAVNCDLNAVLPGFIAEGLREGIPLMGRRIAGFDAGHAVLTGVETRSSSPVRIERDEYGCASVAGLYPLGEGAGYAGGITSAAADGIRGVLASIKQL